MTSNGTVRGLEQAIGRFGTPVIWHRHFCVSAETMAYWQRLADRRVAEVVLLVQRRNGRYLLHTKTFYPQGAYRLLSGGIKPGEDLMDAVRRETFEETGLTVRLERFLGIVYQQFEHADACFEFSSFIFELVELGGVLGVQDEDEQISDYREIMADELVDVACALESLPPDWADWGRFRAAAHRLAASVLLGDTVS